MEEVVQDTSTDIIASISDNYQPLRKEDNDKAVDVKFPVLISTALNAIETLRLHRKSAHQGTVA